MNRLIWFVVGGLLGGGAMRLVGSGAQSRLRSLEGRLEAAEREKEGLRKRLAEAGSQSDKLKGDVERFKKQARSQENATENMEDTCFRLQQENKKLRCENDILARDLSEYKALVVSLREH